MDRTNSSLVLVAILASGACAERPARSPRPSPISTPVPGFDGERAHDDLRRQVAFGPRVPGTLAHRRTGRWIADSLRPLADEVMVDEFVGASQPMTNIIARFGPPGDGRVLVAAHWDSRPRADADPVRARRAEAVPGANDGASGVAVLLELARLFAARPPPVGVDLAFFDGEDYGTFGGRWDEVLLGSQRFAASWKERPRFGIVLDMVGDADLAFPREENSWSCCREIVEKVWSVAAELGHEDVFLPGRGRVIVDDHIPLIQAGMSVIDLIDLEYPPWHTTGDTVDKTSAASLQVVGEVVAEVIYREVEVPGREPDAARR